MEIKEQQICRHNSVPSVYWFKEFPLLSDTKLVQLIEDYTQRMG